jgi:hypothetical protein
MHGKIKHIKHGKIKVKKMKFINQSYGQAYTKVAMIINAK